MTVIQLFTDQAPPVSNDNHDEGESYNVVCLVPNKRLVPNVPAKTVYRQMEALMVNNGVDFSCPQASSDYKIITYLVQGMLDRTEGKLSSDRCMMLDLLRLTFGNEKAADVNETHELFGDLLGNLN